MTRLAAGALREWDRLQTDHPRVARVMARPMYGLWWAATRVRPSLAALRAPSVAPSESEPEPPDAVPQDDPLVDEVEGVPAAPGTPPGPRVVSDRESLVAAGIEYVYLVPGEGVFVIGWLFDPLDRVVDLRAVAGAATSENVLDQMERRLRADVRQAHLDWTEAPEGRGYGRMGLTRIPGALREDMVGSLRFELADRDGRTWSIPAPSIRSDPVSPMATVEEILERFPSRDADQIDRHLGPTIAALWGSRPSLSSTVEVLDIGAPKADPLTSLVIPILDRQDLISYLLAAMADDPAMRDAELIFVLADSATASDGVRKARQLQPLYGLPFRIVSPSRDIDRNGAVNAGVAAARGAILVLLDPHVLPSPGWLAQLLDTYADLPAPGAVGPRLMRSDGSLYSDGVEFTADRSRAGMFSTEHPGRGLPPSPASPGPGKVAALSGACLVVSRDLYLRVGGLDEAYLLGHSADIDLCLKLREVDCSSYVAQAVAMTIIDSPSPHTEDGGLDDTLRLYGEWLLNSQWQRELAGLAEATRSA